MFAWIKLIAYAGFSGLMPSILRHNGIKRILHTSDSEILLPMKKNELHSDNLIRALEIRKETYLGTIDPYYSSDYFIHNETDYLNENLPEYYNVHRRNQSICKGDTISNFYKTHFCQNNSSNMAIIVPYEHLDKLKTIFEKNIILGRYESLEDFCIFPPFQIKSRKQYDSIVDLSSDRELWELDRPLFSKIQTKNKSKTIVLDVIIRSKYNSPESVTMNELAHRMWRESYGVASGWHNSGVRCDIPEHNPHFLLGTTKFMSGYKNRQYAHNFPVRGVHNGDRQDSAALLRYEKNIRRVCAYLQKHCNGCGWFTGTPQFSSLGHTDPTKTNRLTGRGKEWQYVLPADEQQVLEWVQNGSVESGKVILVRRITHPDEKRVELNSSIDFSLKFTQSWFGDTPENFLAVLNSKAKIVVICEDEKDPYCDYTMMWANKYHRWLAKCHPKSKQRIVISKSSGLILLKWHFREHCENNVDEVMRKVFSEGDIAEMKKYRTAGEEFFHHHMKFFDDVK